MPVSAKSFTRGRLKRALTMTRAGRLLLIGPRAAMALRAARVAPQLGRALSWSMRSREIANFTYETTRDNQLLLAAALAEITQRPTSEIVGYLDEFNADHELADHVTRIAQRPENCWAMDPGLKPGRRIAFYLLARALKPRRVVEAGVDKGLGALLLSRALRRNAQDGHAGSYLGIELDAEKPITLFEAWPDRVGRIVRGASTGVLRSSDEPIDLFVHDTIPEPVHFMAQLEAVRPRMSRRGVVASTWTTPELIQHALHHRLRFLTHQEETVDHWFQGDRMAFLYGYAGSSDGRHGEEHVTSTDLRV